MATKIAALSALLKGADIFGDNDAAAGLRRYHAARAAINGNRCCVLERRLGAIKKALKGFLVIVARANDYNSDVRIFNPATKSELIW